MHQHAVLIQKATRQDAASEAIERNVLVYMPGQGEDSARACDLQLLCSRKSGRACNKSTASPNGRVKKNPGEAGLSPVALARFALSVGPFEAERGHLSGNEDPVWSRTRPGDKGALCRCGSVKSVRCGVHGRATVVRSRAALWQTRSQSAPICQPRRCHHKYMYVPLHWRCPFAGGRSVWRGQRCIDQTIAQQRRNRVTEGLPITVTHRSGVRESVHVACLLRDHQARTLGYVDCSNRQPERRGGNASSECPPFRIASADPPCRRRSQVKAAPRQRRRLRLHPAPTRRR